ncbi:MAG: hypothetical protein KTR24_06805 [Saprospiraceae bacterium]|nr:hypothetical protein [Saprospiraceae bacterium]
MELHNVQAKVKQYQAILENTSQYRKDWQNVTRKMITDNLQMIIDETGLPAQIDHQDNLLNLEAIALTLGQTNSGIAEDLGKTKRHLIKSNGALVYQQLFNGKIMISIFFPFIEGLAQPKQPKMIEILRPEELKPPFLIRHVETLLKEVITWEDYDDDVPQKIGFSMGFQPEMPANEQ